jgi:hypothetical protein
VPNKMDGWPERGVSEFKPIQNGHGLVLNGPALNGWGRRNSRTWLRLAERGAYTLIRNTSRCRGRSIGYPSRLRFRLVIVSNTPFSKSGPSRRAGSTAATRRAPKEAKRRIILADPHITHSFSTFHRVREREKAPSTDTCSAFNV